MAGFVVQQLKDMLSVGLLLSPLAHYH